MYQPPRSHDYSIPIAVFLLLRTVLNTKFYVCGRWQTAMLSSLLLASSSGVDFSICFYLGWTCELRGQIECGRSDCAALTPGLKTWRLLLLPSGNPAALWTSPS